MWLAELFPLLAPDPQVSLIMKPCSCFLIDLTWCVLLGLCVLLPALWMCQLCSRVTALLLAFPLPLLGSLWFCEGGMLMEAICITLWYAATSRICKLFKNNPTPAPMLKSSRLQHRLIQMRFMMRRKEDLSSQTPT